LRCRFLDEYDLKVPSGPYKYKKAAEFLMNTTIIGIKGIVTNILKAKEEAAARAATAEAKVAEVSLTNFDSVSRLCTGRSFWRRCCHCCVCLLASGHRHVL
jgi:hypothetical protein